MSLPQGLNLSQTQNTWATQLDPVLKFPPIQGLLLTGVDLKTGVNSINHLLGRKQQGWIVTDKTAVADMYRSQPFNNLTLTLTSSADVTISLWVY